MSFYLCEDLIDEIFIRLPFESLVRNTSLSKSWRSRVSTPSFIRKHTLRSVTAPLPPQKYFLRKYARYDPSCIMMTLSRGCFLLENHFISVKHCFEIVGSCNGIICLFDQDVQSITLWNPSIRRKLTVPTYPSSNKKVLFGFGFDPIRYDYKVVAMSYEAAQSSFIYSLKTNSWSKILSATPNVYDVPFNSSSACFFNGTLHWVVRCKLNDIKQCCIITFDLSTNVIGFISLPNPDLYYYAPMIIKGCLAVMFRSTRDGRNHYCSIWVMREYNNAASWAKAFNISEGILINKDYKDSITYNHESQTRSGVVVDSSYKIYVDMGVESLELIDKEIVRDESYFLQRSFIRTLH